MFSDVVWASLNNFPIMFWLLVDHNNSHIHTSRWRRKYCNGRKSECKFITTLRRLWPVGQIGEVTKTQKQCQATGMSSSYIKMMFKSVPGHLLATQ